MSISSSSNPVRRRGLGPKYLPLLEDRKVRDWYDNLLQGSGITAKKYLRRLGSICASKGITPADIVKCAREDDRWSYNFLINLVRELAKSNRAGSYIEDEKKVIVSWLRHNGLEVRGKVKVRGSDETPTLRDKVPISQANLRGLLACSSPQVHVIVSLMAQSGLRPETIGNEEGRDGLWLSDILELQLEGDKEGIKVSFLKVPPMIVVKPG